MSLLGALPMTSEEPIPPQKEHVSEVLDPPSKQQR